MTLALRLSFPVALSLTLFHKEENVLDMEVEGRIDCVFLFQSPQNLDKVLDQSWEKERDRGILSRENRERGEKESNTKDNGRNSSPGSINREQQPQQLGTTGRQQDDSRQHSPTSLRIPHSPDIVGQVSGTPNQGSAVTSSPTALPPVNQMIMSPSTSLHHMQQLLQQHVLTPTQLQSLMKQHSMYLQQSQHQQHPVNILFIYVDISRLIKNDFLILYNHP